MRLQLAVEQQVLRSKHERPRQAHQCQPAYRGEHSQPGRHGAEAQETARRIHFRQASGVDQLVAVAQADRCGGRPRLGLSNAKLVDHSTIKKLKKKAQDWVLEDRQLLVTGLDNYRALSEHPHAARVLKTA